MLYLDFLLNAYTQLLTSHDKGTKDERNLIYNELVLNIQEFDGISANDKINYLEHLKHIKKLYDTEE